MVARGRLAIELNECHDGHECPFYYCCVFYGDKMSIDRFQVVLKLANIHEDDRVWFGRWLRRYAVFLRQSATALLPVSQNGVKQFCRTLLAREVPAWQRLQAVRAIEFYRNEVLNSAEPDLLEIRQILSRTADGDLRLQR